MRKNCTHCNEQKLNTYILTFQKLFCCESCIAYYEEENNVKSHKRLWKVFEWEEVNEIYKQVDNTKFTCHYLKHYGW
jgi:hypothetical protein